jgi:hypothetical protein
MLCTEFSMPAQPSRIVGSFECSLHTKLPGPQRPPTSLGAHTAPRRRLAALAAELSDELYDTELAGFVSFLDQARCSELRSR